MKKHRNIFTGDTVTVTDIFSVDGQDQIEYEKEKKQHTEHGRVIRKHTKPAYVFTATYKEVRV